MKDEKEHEQMLSNTFKKHSVDEWLEHLNEREQQHQRRIYEQRARLLDDILPEMELLRADQRLLLEHERNLLP